MEIIKTNKCYRKTQITCPYCRAEIPGFWNFGNRSGGYFHCRECERTFYVEVEKVQYYKSYKVKI